MGNFFAKDNNKPLYKKGSIIPINKKKKDYKPKVNYVKAKLNYVKPKVNYVKYNYYSKKKIYNNNNNDKTKN